MIDRKISLLVMERYTIKSNRRTDTGSGLEEEDNLYCSPIFKMNVVKGKPEDEGRGE